jgi:hypothetical protein
VNAALKAIAEAMNVLEAHYCDSETRFNLGSRHHGALSLIYVIDAGLRAEAERDERLQNGKFTEDDLKHRDL